MGVFMKKLFLISLLIFLGSFSLLFSQMGWRQQQAANDAYYLGQQLFYNMLNDGIKKSNQEKNQKKFWLENRTNVSFLAIYMKNSGTESWGENMGTLDNGYKAEILCSDLNMKDFKCVGGGKTYIKYNVPVQQDGTVCITEEDEETTFKKALRKIESWLDK